MAHTISDRLALRARMVNLPLAWSGVAVREVFNGRPGQSLHPGTMVFIGASVFQPPDHLQPPRRGRSCVVT